MDIVRKEARIWGGDDSHLGDSGSKDASQGFKRDIREMESERLEKVIKDSGTRENFLKQKRVTMFFSF